MDVREYSKQITINDICQETDKKLRSVVEVGRKMLLLMLLMLLLLKFDTVGRVKHTRQHPKPIYANLDRYLLSTPSSNL